MAGIDVEGKETLLEEMKANSTLFEFNIILSEIFISEWTLSLICILSCLEKAYDTFLSLLGCNLSRPFNLIAITGADN